MSIWIEAFANVSILLNIDARPVLVHAFSLGLLCLSNVLFFTLGACR